MRTQEGTRVTARRLPLAAGAALSLLAGLWGGLALLDVPVPPPRAAMAQQHGPLMALGFLGTLISLERAVALGRLWAYAAPALAGLGAVATAAGFALPGRLLLTVAGGWLVAVYLAFFGRRTGGVLGVAALLLFGGCAVAAARLVLPPKAPEGTRS